MVFNSYMSDIISDIELIGLILASSAHDVGHPGLNNRYLINTKDKMAIRCKLYLDNDKSVLEMMHSSILFQILSIPDFNIFSELQSDFEASIRKLIIDLILCTDMAKHMDTIAHFKSKVDLNN